MVVGLDPRMALRVVAHVDEYFVDALRQHHLLEQGAGAGPLLVDRDPTAGRYVRVPDSVGAALGDSGEQCLRRERSLDVTGRAQAVSGDSTHLRKPLE